MKNQVLKYLIYSQVILYGALTLSIILAPASLGSNSGFSYFGTHRQTVIPYGGGLLASAYFILRAASALVGSKKFEVLRYGLIAMAPLMAGVVVVPAVGNGIFDLLHRIFGSSLFSIELLLSGWFVWRNVKSWLNWLLLGLQLLGGILSLIYLSPAHGFLLQSQLLFQLAFSAILLRSMYFYSYSET